MEFCWIAEAEMLGQIGNNQVKYVSPYIFYFTLVLY